MDPIKQAMQSQEINAKVARVFQRRLEIAQQHFRERVQAAWKKIDVPVNAFQDPVRFWSQAFNYAVDATQRSILFWDTLRQRGNNYREHKRRGQPPLLHFDYETVLDARKFDRPVNYALLKILPPAGVTVDPKRRPYIIIDPRAGHGPGIGGFKDDSQVGVAIRDGHPVYFVVFFRDPEKGQTMLDVCAAEQKFVHKVRELHPDSPKPAIVGNCQGGWAAMMVAASDPEDTGPIVINGAPMSYWGGAWAEGEGDNPMRYAGGMLGGTWLASLSADMGAGIFDGANLVSNFENLNPANSLWDKYYNLYSQVDTEAPRFLEFERWWGGYFLMNREEIEWIVRNLFVGNKLWTGGAGVAKGQAFDLKAIRSPIVLFASLGDNITPPQQAFNWVADVYRSTDELKANGQIIVGLLHQDIGHLGIFVSGKVAKREHAQIVSVLKSVEALAPGIYGMAIHERRNADGGIDYEVEFREHTLEELAPRLNRFRRVDEKPFEAVARISDFNQTAYELLAQPLVQSMANEAAAEFQRELNPLRVEHWAVSDLNPWLAWLPSVAEAVRTQRREIGPDDPLRKLERFDSECVSASLDYYRAVRDAITEAAFFETYGNVFSLLVTDHEIEGAPAAAVPPDPRELAVVKDALKSIAKGGLPEALTRIAALIAEDSQHPFSLEEVAVKRDLLRDYGSLLPPLPPDQWRRIRGEQDIIVRYEPTKAITTLPGLVADPAERERMLQFLEQLFCDPRFVAAEPTAKQRAMLAELGDVLKVDAARRDRIAKALRSGRQPTPPGKRRR